jgi:AraC family transcriptional regulator, positive regulator of tynA and feaB
MQGLAMIERAWTTTVLPQREQFAFWRDVVWQAFVPVALSRPDEGGFASTCATRRVGPMGMAWIASQGQSVSRTESQIKRNAGDVFFLNMPLSGGASASQDGRTAQLRSGDFVLVDSARPFELSFEREFEQISFTLPHDALAPLLAAPSEVTGVRIPGDRGVGAVAAAAIRALATATGPLSTREERGLTDQVVGLVALAIGGLRRAPVGPGRTLLLQAALDEIERSLDDPALSPDRVAQRLNISVRYLHKLFAERGTTFGRSVLARRLERCHRDLGDPGARHSTVAEIAYRHGFGDSAHFARAFKARYGMTPGERRRAGGV